MKTIALVLAVCFVGAMALTDDQKAKLAEYRTACIAETGVDSQVVDNAKNGNFADDEKLECFAACVLKKIGIMRPDGSISEEVTRQKAPADIPKEKIDDVINKCKDITGPTDCKKAANLAKCFIENKSFNVITH